ncbi:MAG: hypothetical protein R2704_09005 [Microthrixaceae bacterium]
MTQPVRQRSPTNGAFEAAQDPPLLERRALNALWEGYLLLRVSQVANAAAVTMDPRRGPRSRPLGLLATGIAGAATWWEWQRGKDRDHTINDPAVPAEVVATSLALMALSPYIVRDADRERGDDWFGLWGWWGHSAIALALPNRPGGAMFLHLLPQMDAARFRRKWLPKETAVRNMLNAVGVAVGSGLAVKLVRRTGAQADRASARLVAEQGRVLADQARREVRERRLHATVDSLREVRADLAGGDIAAAVEHAAATYEPLRAWLSGAEDDETTSPTASATGHADEMTRLVSRTERALAIGDLAVVASSTLNALSVTAARFNRQRRREWVVAGLTSSVIYAGAVAIGRFGLRERPGAASEPSAILDRVWSPRADVLFAVLFMAFECASSDRSMPSTWAAGQSQVHVAVAATRIPEPAKLAQAWAIMGLAMFLADRYYTPEARTHRFRWQADWINGMAAGLALRRSHNVIWDALNELERNANDTIETVAKRVAEAELVAAQDAVHDTACQSLRYLLTHPDADPDHLSEIIGVTIDNLEGELAGDEPDESGALADALESCAAGYELLGLSPSVTVSGDRPVGGAAMEVLVQVLNQGLANVLAHSDDLRPEIDLTLSDGDARLSVSNLSDSPYRGAMAEEEAEGDEPPTVSPLAETPDAVLPPGGFGLASARRAVNALGGTLTWGDRSDRTELILTLPLAPDGSPTRSV